MAVRIHGPEAPTISKMRVHGPTAGMQLAPGVVEQTQPEQLGVVRSAGHGTIRGRVPSLREQAAPLDRGKVREIGIDSGQRSGFAIGDTRVHHEAAAPTTVTVVDNAYRATLLAAAEATAIREAQTRAAADRAVQGAQDEGFIAQLADRYDMSPKRIRAMLESGAGLPAMPAHQSAQGHSSGAAPEPELPEPELRKSVV